LARLSAWAFILWECTLALAGPGQPRSFAFWQAFSFFGLLAFWFELVFLGLDDLFASGY